MSSVKFLKFEGGERYPILFAPEGMPHQEATLFASIRLRNANKMPNTIKAALDALALLYEWASKKQIDLRDRFSQRIFLSSHELDTLNDFVRRKRKSGKSAGVVIPMKGARQRESRTVEMKTAHTRMTYIADYLSWLATYRVESASGHVDSDTSAAIREMATDFRSQRPSLGRRSTLSSKRGLSKIVHTALLEVVEPGSASNPFSDAVQRRNNLIVRLLDDTGIRSGELLALKASDFDFSRSEVVIHRRHDDASDPRAHQPVAKTQDRRLPLTTDLLNEVIHYINTDRKGVGRSHSHPFLLVTHQPGPHCGSPLTASGLAKIFRAVKKSHEKLGKVSPHLLRHTNNDRFSDLMDSEKVSPANEEKMRSYAMGWKEGSGTASTYTRRTTERKAKEAFLKMQRKHRRPEGS